MGMQGLIVSSTAAYVFGGHLVTCLASAKHLRLHWLSGQALELGVNLWLWSTCVLVTLDLNC